MSARSMLTALDARQYSGRQAQRYVFRRRGLMTTDELTVPIRTVDVSMQGLSVMSPMPIKAGKLCSIGLHAVVGARVIPLQFSCRAMHSILAGADGFRTSLYVDVNVEAHKQQLQKIIAVCAFLSPDPST